MDSIQLKIKITRGGTRMLVKFILGWDYDTRNSVRTKYYGLYIDTSKEDEINSIEFENAKRPNK